VNNLVIPRSEATRDLVSADSREEPRSLALLGMTIELNDDNKRTTTTLQPLKDRDLLGDQLFDLIHELRRRHVFGLFLAASADVYFARLRLFVANDQ